MRVWQNCFYGTVCMLTHLEREIAALRQATGLVPRRVVNRDFALRLLYVDNTQGDGKERCEEQGQTRRVASLLGRR